MHVVKRQMDSLEIPTTTYNAGFPMIGLFLMWYSYIGEPVLDMNFSGQSHQNPGIS